MTKETKERVVKGCFNCPFLNERTMGNCKIHADRIIERCEHEGVYYPDWCPLKDINILITLKD